MLNIWGTDDGTEITEVYGNDGTCVDERGTVTDVEVHCELWAGEDAGSDEVGRLCTDEVFMRDLADSGTVELTERLEAALVLATVG
jgi:hypothetical protein